MRLHLLYLGDQHIAQVYMQRLDRVDRSAQHGEPLAKIAYFKRSAKEIFEPATGDVHPLLCSPTDAPGRNWARKRMSPSYSSRMSGMPYRNMAVRGGPMPKAQPV